MTSQVEIQNTIFLPDMWSNPSNISVQVTILLPNGLLLLLQTSREISLQDLKEEIWEEARAYPLFGSLRESQAYIFVCVSCTTSEQEEIEDERRRLDDVRPFQAVLKLSERKPDAADRHLNAQIGVLIDKGLHEFEALRDSEVTEFRWKMRSLSEGIAQGREKQSWEGKLLYQYPLRLETNPCMGPALEDKIKDGFFVIGVRFAQCQEQDMPVMKLYVAESTTPDELLIEALTRRLSPHTPGGTKRSVDISEDKDIDELLLKVFGRQEFLLGTQPLVQYKYIREKLADEKMPELVVINKTDVELDDGELYVSVDEIRSVARNSFYGSTTLGRSPKHGSHSSLGQLNSEISAWDVKENFAVTVLAVDKINCMDGAKVCILGGLYHGGDLLCEQLWSAEATVLEGCWPKDRSQPMEFDLTLENLPRMTRLCFALVQVGGRSTGKAKKAKGSKQEVSQYMPLAWANTMVYDFRNRLKTGGLTLGMWPSGVRESQAPEGQYLNPLGTVASNSSQGAATILTIKFTEFARSTCYPSFEAVMEYAAQVMRPGEGESSLTMPHASKLYLEQLRQICERDPLHQLHEQEKELLWFLRQDCCHLLPHSLPKLLRSLKWQEKSHVAQMTAFLQIWPTLAPEQALELLDYAYADQSVRSFAVRCLKTLSDEDLLLYLLQLVQALKFESYLDGDLVKFLLERALRNQAIGHSLFWLLRSEMSNPSVSVLFGAILEAYCRGAVQHMRTLSRQVLALNKLKSLSGYISLLCEKKKESRERVRQRMHGFLEDSYCQDCFRCLLNPLDPSQRTLTLRVEKCRFMDSKMKPLWLVFENFDKGSEDIMIMFKNGDDLRQDMLTLQMIRIMDKLWKDEGLDLRMLPYHCLATEHKSGLIEIVQCANTIANIQRGSSGILTATSVFKKGALFNWLKEHNPDEQSLNKAVREFTLSCAGYCVATYVLGIADRHSDNIMVRKNGQLFHIDFGHILGNFKEKFGIKRERTPFVLTLDFVYVITRGHSQKSQEFYVFQQYCEQAFLVLRRHGPLIVSLFALMLSTGIPEVSSEKDLDYLRESLALDMANEAEALQHFRAKFLEALRNSWATSINWFAHILAKDNSTSA